MPLEVGQIFAGYEIVGTLGVGGMGEVYLGKHPRLPRRDALKVLRGTVTDDQEYRQRFIREADIVAGLSHPNIVAVHDRGEFDGQLWIAMDYIEGTDAGRLLSEHYPEGMPADDAVRIVRAIAEALDYAHGRDLLHRDIKPANILLTDPDAENARIYLGDFGIARWTTDDSSKLTATDVAVGTVAYAAPEQLLGGDVDGRADQYALAATAFQLLTGKPLFAHGNQAMVISQHISAAPPNIADRRPELSPLGPVFDKALAKSPTARYPDCRQFADALQMQLGTGDHGPHDLAATQPALPPHKSPSPASVPENSSIAEKRPDRRKLLLVVGIVVGLVVAALGAVVAVLEMRPTQAAPHIPVVIIGADCEPLGSAGVSPSGAQAYCAHLASIGAPIWSLYTGPVAVPTVTPGPTDAVYPRDIEQQVRVCVEQAVKSRLACREDVRRGNLTGPA